MFMIVSQKALLLMLTARFRFFFRLASAVAAWALVAFLHALALHIYIIMAQLPPAIPSMPLHLRFEKQLYQLASFLVATAGFTVTSKLLLLNGDHSSNRPFQSLHWTIVIAAALSAPLALIFAFWNLTGSDKNNLSRELMLLASIAVYIAAVYVLIILRCVVLLIARRSIISSVHLSTTLTALLQKVKSRHTTTTNRRILRMLAFFLALTAFIGLMHIVLHAHTLHGSMDNNAKQRHLKPESYLGYFGVLGESWNFCRDGPNGDTGTPPTMWWNYVPRRALNFFTGSERCRGHLPELSVGFSFYDIRSRELYVAATCPDGGSTPKVMVEDVSKNSLWNLDEYLFYQNMTEFFLKAYAVHWKKNLIDDWGVFLQYVNSSDDVKKVPLPQLLPFPVVSIVTKKIAERGVDDRRGGKVIDVSCTIGYLDWRKGGSTMKRALLLLQYNEQGSINTISYVLSKDEDETISRDDLLKRRTTSMVADDAASGGQSTSAGSGYHHNWVVTGPDRLSGAALRSFARQSNSQLFYRIPVLSHSTYVKCGSLEEYQTFPLGIAPKVRAMKAQQRPPATEPTQPLNRTRFASFFPPGEPFPEEGSNFTFPPKTTHRPQLLRRQRPPPPKPFSLLIIHFDSISRAGFIRNFPRTVQWLRERRRATVKRSSSDSALSSSSSSYRAHWIDFLGVTTVGFSTATNLPASMTGHILDESKSDRASGSLFNAAKDYFGDDGIFTAFLPGVCSDTAGEFNFRERTHFGRSVKWLPHEDEYWRNTALDDELLDQMCHIEYGPLFGNFQGPYSLQKRCIGKRYVHQHMLDYIASMLYDLHHPTTVSSSSNNHSSQSHSTLSDGSNSSSLLLPYLIMGIFLEPHEGTQAVAHLVDDDLIAFLDFLDALGFFDTSALAMYSDHGCHMGPYFERTLGGKMERTQPIGFFSLPDELITNRSIKIEDILVNEKSITSTLDLYHTMRDIIGLPRLPRRMRTTTFNPWKGQSLLRPLRKPRNDCHDAHGEVECYITYCAK